MNRVHLPRVCFLLAILLLPSPALSQELGLFYNGATSNNPEFPRPRGFAAQALMPFNEDWLFRVSFHRMTDDSVKDGMVCRHYVPHVNCRTEKVRTALSLTGLRLGVHRTLHSGDNLRFGAGTGFSFNSLGGEAVGSSGLEADLLVPNGGQIGAFGFLSLALVPYPRVPITFQAGLNAHWVKFNACSGGTPPQYDPFCTPSTFQEWEMGLSLPLR